MVQPDRPLTQAEVDPPIPTSTWLALGAAVSSLFLFMIDAGLISVARPAMEAEFFEQFTSPAVVGVDRLPRRGIVATAGCRTSRRSTWPQALLPGGRPRVRIQLRPDGPRPDRRAPDRGQGRPGCRRRVLDLERACPGPAAVPRIPARGRRRDLGRGGSGGSRTRPDGGRLADRPRRLALAVRRCRADGAGGVRRRATSPRRTTQPRPRQDRRPPRRDHRTRRTRAAGPRALPGSPLGVDVALDAAGDHRGDRPGRRLHSPVPYGRVSVARSDDFSDHCLSGAHFGGRVPTGRLLLVVPDRPADFHVVVGVVGARSRVGACARAGLRGDQRPAGWTMGRSIRAHRADRRLRGTRPRSARSG